MPKQQSIKLIRTAQILLILFLPCLLILASFYSLLYNEKFYKEQFQKNKVYEKLPNADVTLKNLMSYFKWKPVKLNFTQKEKAHLLDVKILLGKTLILFFSSLIIFIISMLFLLESKKTKELFYALLFGSILTLIIVFSVLLVNFDFLFIKFHQVFFPKGNWIFPSKSKLIILFPQSFFYEALKRIFIGSSIIALFILIFSRIMLYSYKIVKHIKKNRKQ